MGFTRSFILIERCLRFARRNKSIYFALGVSLDGQKELLGMCLSENEGAKFWLKVLTEIQNRGEKDILIAYVDGL